MKVAVNRGVKCITALFTGVILLMLLSFFAFSADDKFEKSIAAFPESYKPQLRELHEKYPNWQFIPFVTNLDWSDVIDGEYGSKSLVQSSASSKIWKSHDEDDYNPADGSFDFKDGGFVQANRFAVEYFIDPRNFLTEDGIFQFEVLEFNENYTLEMIERVLKGSFMSKAKITYLKYDEKNDKLTTVKTDKTYSEVIYAAGKKYNINPCYIASKILNEVGSDGSYSIYGDHPTYPGIYNFYNIGATDGTGAIARGLLWAKGGSSGSKTYGRPWTTPEKSIMGGAQFLSEEYIAKGQYTGYLQRFNVNPDGSYKLYSHQYMTNLTGALSQGYTTYASYAALGMLDSSITFSIPVYENMSGQQDNTGTVKLSDSKVQYGNINSTKALLKTGPAKSYANVKTSSGAQISFKTSTRVKILSKVFTDSEYYLNILACPIWYNISVTVDGKTYKGYVDGDFVDITTLTYVPAGEFTMQYFKSNPELFGGLVSSDYRYCTVEGEDTVEFLKNGSVYITAYTSNGCYDKAKFTVSGTDYAVKGMKVSSTQNSVTVSISKNSNAESYGYYLVDIETGDVKATNKTALKYTFSSLPSGRKYRAYARTVIDYSNKNGSMKGLDIATKPSAPEGLKYDYAPDGTPVIMWNAVSGADGYYVFGFDKAADKFVQLAQTDAVDTSFSVSEKYLDYSTFAITAYMNFNTSVIKSSMSESIEVQLDYSLSEVTGIKLTDVQSTSYTLSWEPVRFAEYYILYGKTDNGYEKLAEIEGTSHKLTNLVNSKVNYYKLTAARGKSDSFIESEKAKEFSAVTKPGAVTTVKSTAYVNKVKLTWNAVKNADYYTVYLYENGKYVFKADSSKNSYTLEGLKDASQQKVRIRAYIKSSLGKQKGDRITYTFVTKAKTVDNIYITEQKADSYVLNWSASSKAVNSYRIYRYDKAKKKFVRIKTTSSLSYKVQNLKPATTDRYYIIPYVVKNGETYTKGDKSKEFSFNTKLYKPSSVSVSKTTKNSVVLKWSKSENASYYRVYMYDDAKKKYVLTATPKTTSYTVKGLKSGKTYKFKIRPMRYSAGIRYYGYYSSVVKAKTK